MITDIKKFINNSSWVMFGQIMQMALSFFVGAITARYLQPDGYGLINVGLSYVSILSSLSSLGIEGLLINELIKNKDKEGTVLGTAMVLRIIASLLSIVGITCFLYAINPSNTELIIITSVQSVSLIFNIYEWIEYWFQSKLLSKYAVIARLIAAVTVAFVRILFIQLNLSVMAFAVVQVIYSASCFFALYYIFCKNGRPKFHFDMKYAGVLVKTGNAFLISNICIYLYTRIDKLVISYFLTEFDVGLYSAAVTLSEALNFLPQAIIVSARPLIFDAAKNNLDYRRRIIQLYSFVLYCTLFISLFFFVFGRWTIYIVYGSDYLGASLNFKILTVANIFSLLGTARTILLVCENKMNYLKYYTFTGGILNLILNILSINYLGTMGVALATALSQFVVTIVAPLFFKETRGELILFLESVKFWKYFKFPFNIRHDGDN